MAKKVILRADGNSKIGLGHVMRCVAIGQMLINNFEISFAIQNPEESMIKMLTNEHFKIISLPSTSNMESDCFNLLNLTTEKDIIVLDGYNFKAEYQKKIKEFGAKLVYIDDLHAGHQFADIIINHAGSINESEYTAEPNTKFLLGTKYALLRKEFWHNTSETKVPIRFNKILLNFGGADPINMTKKVGEMLLSQTLAPNRKISVILGSNYQFFDSIRHWEDDERVIFYNNLRSIEMKKLIIQNQLAIVSCSTIAYEIAALNRCFIGISTADNQKGLANFFKQNKLALDVLDKDFIDFQLYYNLMSQKDEKRASLIAQKDFFDGKYKQRILNTFLNL